jgi:two-component sensor histidine kinase
MKNAIFTCVIVCASLQGIAQDTSPEARVLACVRQGEYYINKPGRGPKELDSADVSLKTGEEISKSYTLHTTDGELLFLAGMISKQKGLKEEGNRLNDLALTFLRKKQAAGGVGNDFLGRSLLEKGDYLHTEDDKQLDEKIALLKEAIPCFDSSGYAKSRAAVWKSLGDLYEIHPSNPGNMGLALEAYQRAMEAYLSFGYKNIQDIYIEMARIYKRLGDNQQGLRYCLAAVQTAERAKDTSLTLCEIYNYTGMQYMSLMDYPDAKKYYGEALKIAEKYNDTNGIFSLEINLYTFYIQNKEYVNAKHVIDRVYAHFPKNDPENQFVSSTLYLRYYTTLSDTVNGQKYCLLLVKLTADAKDQIQSYAGRDTYTAMANFYTLKHDFNNADKYWQKAYTLMMTSDYSPGNKNYLIYQRYKIDTTQHKWKSAALYLNDYTDRRDSMYSVNKATQEANLRVIYDTKQKEFELAESKQKIEMLTQNERLQRANLKQAVLIRDITIVSTIMVIIVSVLLYRMVVLYRKGMKKIAKSNSLLEKLVSEKEWLLKEIHHRVKNNLHTVTCLLESQAAYLEKDALKAIEDSRHRIYAMSLIHQKLYENEDVKIIEINDYVTALIQYLRDCYDLKSNISFHLEIAPVSIDTSIAIPIGLIINEAVTNSIKYAFVNRAHGQITIKLHEQRDKIVVIISDDGVGIDMELLNTSTRSMGLRLIRGLTGDIGGKVSFNNEHGTEIRLVCSRTLVDDDEINIQELLNNIHDPTEG